MASPVVIVRRALRRLPAPVKSVLKKAPGLGSLNDQLREQAYRAAGHQEIYDEAYYRNRDAEPSARAIAKTVTEIFGPERILDVGCGTGDLLDAMRTEGVTGNGLELSDAALKICKERGLAVQKFDLEHDPAPELPEIDLVVSTEVAEHLPESCADRYVELLTSYGPSVVFTAAPPGQGGTDHVNEQPPEYWIAKFNRHGFVMKDEETERCRRDWREAGAQPWYYENVLVFSSNDQASADRP